MSDPAAAAPPPPPQLMVIFSLGGLWLTARGKGRAVRCIPGFLPLDGSHRVILDPFPRKGMRGVLEEGRARVLRGDDEVGNRAWDGSYPPAGRRWGDLDLVAFAGRTLWTWIGLPLAFPGGGQADAPPEWPATSRHHVLERDGEGNVVRHVESSLVHELSGHCEFGGAVVATRRRTRTARGVTVLWADVVAAALHGKPLNSSRP